METFLGADVALAVSISRGKQIASPFSAREGAKWQSMLLVSWPPPDFCKVRWVQVFSIAWRAWSGVFRRISKSACLGPVDTSENHSPSVFKMYLKPTTCIYNPGHIKVHFSLGLHGKRVIFPCCRVVTRGAAVLRWVGRELCDNCSGAVGLLHMHVKKITLLSSLQVEVCLPPLHEQ